MKRNDVREMIPDITDEQLKWLMDEAGRDVNAEKAKTADLKRQLEEALDSVKALEQERDDTAKASTSLEERVKAMEESYAAKERELAVQQNTLAATQIFAGAGLDEASYAPLIEQVVSADADATKASAEAIAALVTAQRDAATTAAKKQMLDGTLSPGGSGGGTPAVTKEQFAKMSYTERLSLFNESPDTYKELNE